MPVAPSGTKALGRLRAPGEVRNQGVRVALGASWQPVALGMARTGGSHWQRLASRCTIPRHRFGGRYELSLAPGAVMGLKRHAQRIREWTKAWVLATAPRLAIGGPLVAPLHFAAATVPGAGLKLSLYRWPGRQGRLRLVFDAPHDAEKQLAAALEKALSEKCGKLAAARECPAVESLLLLEVADVALGNVFNLDPLLADRVRLGLPHPPDHIWLVDSTDEPPTVLIAKQRERLSNEIGNRYLPFSLGGTDAGGVGLNDNN